MKKSLSIILALLMLLSLSACGPKDSNNANGNNAESYTWKFALDEAKGSNQDIYAQIFKEVVEEKSQGRIKLDIYYLGQLGDGADQAELIQNGAIDLGFMATGAAGTMVPEANLFSMHYIFPDDLDKAKQFLAESTVLNETMAQAYESKNMHVIDWMDEGFMQWTNSVRPITSPQDIRELKMRVMSAPIITATYRAYGADPVTIPFADLYSGLSLHNADGQSNPVEIVEQMKYYEVQSYLSIGNSDLYVASLTFNKDLWDSLPQDIQDIINVSVAETRPLYTAEQKAMSDAALTALTNAGMQVNYLSDDAVAEFRALAATAAESFYDIGGNNAEEIYKAFLEEVSQYY